MKKVFLIALFSLTTTLQTNDALALVASPELFGFDFRFNNPGARANAMGGAFIGLADDASAAYTNPAGLTILTQSEVSMEYKQGTYTSQIPDFAPTTFEYESDLGGMSFLSYAYPQEDATIAIFRHNMVNNELDFVWNDPPADTYHSNNHFELYGQTLGFGLGYKLNEKLSLGIAANTTQLEYFATSTGINDGGTSHPLNLDNMSRTSGSDTSEHFTVSLLWNIVDELHLGLVYRQGPEYTYSYESWSWETDHFEPRQPLTSILKVPDVYGAGLAYAFDFGLTISADANHIIYSQIFDDMLWEHPTLPIYVTNNSLTADDIWEYRFGLEYVFTAGQTPVASRAGYYFRPASEINITASGDPDFDNNDWSQDDDNIVSAGVGLVLSENVQLDIAALFGSLNTEGVLSMVYRFE
jgi:long-subunit fatty acid transport protein